MCFCPGGRFVLLEACSYCHRKRQVVPLSKQRKPAPQRVGFFIWSLFGLQLQRSGRDELVDSVVGFEVDSADRQRLTKSRKRALVARAHLKTAELETDSDLAAPASFARIGEVQPTRLCQRDRVHRRHKSEQGSELNAHLDGNIQAKQRPVEDFRGKLPSSMMNCWLRPVSHT